MCSAPRRSIISVPDATTLPSVPRPIRCSNSAITSAGNPCGNVGNGRSSTMPIISQWPVTESLPGDASAIRPYAPINSGDPVSNATNFPSPSARNVGILSGTRAAMLPSVLLPSSPYADASGSSPMPTLSSTMTMTLEKIANLEGPRRSVICAGRTLLGHMCGADLQVRLSMMRGEVVCDRPRRADGGDSVLEHELIGTIDFNDHRKSSEILDARIELAAGKETNNDGKTIAPSVIEEHVLDVGLRRGGSLFSDLGHQKPSPRHPCMASASSTRVRTSSRSPGPSNHLRLGSLRNQINWRRAYRRFSWTMSARVSASPRTPRSISITCR